VSKIQLPWPPTHLYGLLSVTNNNDVLDGSSIIKSFQVVLFNHASCLFLDVRPEFSGSARAWPGSPELGSARQRHWTEPSSLTWTVRSSGRARIGSVQPVWLIQKKNIKIWHGKDR
jgi:hypothetical protein